MHDLTPLNGLRIAICLHIEPKTADLVRTLLDPGLPTNFLGGTEETTTGALLLRQREDQPRFPVIVINDSDLKLLVENRWGVGQSVVQGFMNATNRMIPGTRATVAGYGPCGRGVAQTLRQLGARVSVVSDERVAALPDNAVIAGVGHFPWELDLRRLGSPTRQGDIAGSARQTADHETYLQPDGRRITVLAQTRMINLVSAGGNPIEAMDLGLTLQARSLALVAAGRAAPGIQAVPQDLDREIAETFAATLELS